MRHNLWGFLTAGATAAGAAGVALTVAACSGDTTGTAPAVPTQYYALVLNQHAINMALTDPVHHSSTMQLVATPVDAYGRPMTATGDVTFASSDSSVAVSSAGLLTARYVTRSGGTQILARLQQGGITHVDTAYVRVTDTAWTPVATFSIQPAAGDSAVGAAFSFYTLHLQAQTATRANVAFGDHTQSGSAFLWETSSEPNLALPQVGSGGQFQLADTGHVTFIATSWFYGDSLRDTLRFFIGWPQLQLAIGFQRTAAAFQQKGNMLIGAGGVAEWAYSQRDSSLDLVFDDSAAVDSAPNASGVYTGSGNVTLLPTGVYLAARRFPVPGVYWYHNRANPMMAAKVTVLANPVH